MTLASRAARWAGPRFPGNGVSTGTTNVSFAAGRVRANNGLLKLATDGSGSIRVKNNSPATNHFILDVSGYYL